MGRKLCRPGGSRCHSRSRCYPRHSRTFPRRRASRARRSLELLWCWLHSDPALWSCSSWWSLRSPAVSGSRRSCIPPPRTSFVFARVLAGLPRFAVGADTLAPVELDRQPLLAVLGALGDRRRGQGHAEYRQPNCSESPFHGFRHSPYRMEVRTRAGPASSGNPFSDLHAGLPTRSPPRVGGSARRSTGQRRRESHVAMPA